MISGAIGVKITGTRIIFSYLHDISYYSDFVLSGVIGVKITATKIPERTNLT